MQLKLDTGETVSFIGDPHLGKSFTTGVPLARRGEREKSQFDTFREQLMGNTFDFVVMVGDLFDTPYVSYGTVLETYAILCEAAQFLPETQFIMLAGNHDVPRNLEATGAWHMLEQLCDGRYDNLHIVTVPTQIGPLALFPWEWDKPAAAQTVLGNKNDLAVLCAVGHWDMKSFDGHDDHLAPTRILTKRYGSIPIVSGHYHVEGEYIIDDISVYCTGSMQPYSHGEDPNGDIYVTMTLEELAKSDKLDLKNKCVRVLLEEGEELPTDLDCLSLTPKRVLNEADDAKIDTSTEFNWEDIVKKKLAKLPKLVREFIEVRIK